MEIDKLLENLAVISQILKTPSLTNQIDKDPEFGKKIKEFETLVEKVTLQHGDVSMSNEDLSKLLNELNLSIQEIDTYCDLNKGDDYDQSVGVAVRIDKFSDSSIDMYVRCFTKTNSWTNYLQVKENLALEIKKIVEGKGAAFAFPSQSIYVEKK